MVPALLNTDDPSDFFDYYTLHEGNTMMGDGWSDENIFLLHAFHLNII